MAIRTHVADDSRRGATQSAGDKGSHPAPFRNRTVGAVCDIPEKPPLRETRRHRGAVHPKLVPPPGRVVGNHGRGQGFRGRLVGCVRPGNRTGPSCDGVDPGQTKRRQRCRAVGVSFTEALGIRPAQAPFGCPGLPVALRPKSSGSPSEKAAAAGPRCPWTSTRRSVTIRVVVVRSGHRLGLATAARPSRAGVRRERTRIHRFLRTSRNCFRSVPRVRRSFQNCFRPVRRVGGRPASVRTL